ncbi:hypothetical protein BV20DRAFT_273987 [Pilatotrama ljubarskyi]|nr:hypothetical protein BV20DRAFT_273987 [Pilatotrama ljubarskyi]
MRSLAAAYGPWSVAARTLVLVPKGSRLTGDASRMHSDSCIRVYVGLAVAVVASEYISTAGRSTLRANRYRCSTL